MNLEDGLMADIRANRDVSLERALLIVSGLQTEEEVQSYTRKIDTIHEGFKAFKEQQGGEAKAHQKTAELLFEYFLTTKHERRERGEFLLTDVVDAQLYEDKNKGVGDCVGLAALYSVIGVREGLPLSLLRTKHPTSYNDPAHVKSRLRDGTKVIDIEHLNSSGFGFPCGTYDELPLIFLVAVTYNKRGIARAAQGDFEGEIADLSKAIELDGKNGVYYNNRGWSKLEVRDLNGAYADFNKAIKLAPEFPFPIDGREIVTQDLNLWRRLGMMLTYQFSEFANKISAYINKS